MKHKDCLEKIVKNPLNYTALAITLLFPQTNNSINSINKFFNHHPAFESLYNSEGLQQCFNDNNFISSNSFDENGITELIEESIFDPPQYSIDPEFYMKQLGPNLCASYAKLLVQSLGFSLRNTSEMHAWEMAYNMDKDGWDTLDMDTIKNLVFLKNNLKNNYRNSALTRIERLKEDVGFGRYLRFRKNLKNDYFEEIINEVDDYLSHTLDSMPEGTLLFTRNFNSNFLYVADSYKKNSPTHVIVKHENSWKDYEVSKENVRSSEEIVKLLNKTTHISVPPEVSGFESLQVHVPDFIASSKGINKLNFSRDYASNNNQDMRQYVAFRVYESEHKEIIIKINKTN